MNSASHAGIINPNRSIGALLVDAGRLSPEDAERVLRLSREKSIRFGDAALQLQVVTPADIEHALSRQFDYAYLPVGDPSVAPELVAAFSPYSSTVESLRGLRTQLMLRWFAAEEAQKTLAIVSPTHAEGRSWLAANLAVVFSQLGERTLLIDADMRRPAQHRLFKLDNRKGLSSILAGRATGDEIHRISRLVGLSVLPAGAEPPNPQELLSRAAFAQLLDELRGRFDVILIDTPAAIEYADAHAIAARAGGALMLARKNFSVVSRISDASASIAQAGAAIVGTVMNEY